jgi:hypothetical protein
VVLCYRFAGEESCRQIRPKRLDPDLRYEIVDPFGPTSLGRARGSRLMARGIEVTLEPNSAAVRHLKPIR